MIIRHEGIIESFNGDFGLIRLPNGEQIYLHISETRRRERSLMIAGTKVFFRIRKRVRASLDGKGFKVAHDVYTFRRPATIKE